MDTIMTINNYQLYIAHKNVSAYQPTNMKELTHKVAAQELLLELEIAKTTDAYVKEWNELNVKWNEVTGILGKLKKKNKKTENTESEIKRLETELKALNEVGIKLKNKPIDQSITDKLISDSSFDSLIAVITDFTNFASNQTGMMDYEDMKVIDFFSKIKLPF